MGRGKPSHMEFFLSWALMRSSGKSPTIIWREDLPPKDWTHKKVKVSVTPTQTITRTHYSHPKQEGEIIVSRDMIMELDPHGEMYKAFRRGYVFGENGPKEDTPKEKVAYDAGVKASSHIPF